MDYFNHIDGNCQFLLLVLVSELCECFVGLERCASSFVSFSLSHRTCSHLSARLPEVATWHDLTL